MHKLRELAGLILLLAATVSLAQEKPSLADTSDERLVYAAVLNSLQGSGRAQHMLVADQSSDFSCDESACNGFTVGGCNGLRVSNERISERLAIVRRDLFELELATLKEFESKNEKCSQIPQDIPAKARFYLFSTSNGPKLPSGWEHPDFVYLSRVAFNSAHSQALVYVGFLSGNDVNESGGAYFLLIKDKQNWSVKNSSVVWDMVSPK